MFLATPKYSQIILETPSHSCEELSRSVLSCPMCSCTCSWVHHVHPHIAVVVLNDPLLHPHSEVVVCAVPLCLCHPSAIQLSASECCEGSLWVGRFAWVGRSQLKKHTQTCWHAKTDHARLMHYCHAVNLADLRTMCTHFQLEPAATLSQTWACKA